MDRKVRFVSDSEVETVHIVRPNHLNGAERLFGGTLMQWIDEVGGLVAKRHAKTNVVTASVDRLQFLKGAYLKDVVVLQGKITHVGRTSMEVKVESYIEDIEGHQTLINRAYLTMVGVDKDDKPTTVPELRLCTDAERVEWDKAERRMAARKEAQQEGFY